MAPDDLENSFGVKLGLGGPTAFGDSIGVQDHDVAGLQPNHPTRRIDAVREDPQRRAAAPELLSNLAVAAEKDSCRMPGVRVHKRPCVRVEAHENLGHELPLRSLDGEDLVETAENLADIGVSEGERAQIGSGLSHED
jgi:hypothetical protein